MDPAAPALRFRTQPDRLAWLAGLRLMGLVVLSGLTLGVAPALGGTLPLVPLAGLAGLAAAAVAAGWLLRGLSWMRGDAAVGAHLILDAALLTAWLMLTGGPANPFTSLYHVQVVLAAVTLGPGWAWPMVGVCTAAFAMLFLWHVPADHALGAAAGPVALSHVHAHTDPSLNDPPTAEAGLGTRHVHPERATEPGQPAWLDPHLHGHLLAFTLTSACVAMFVDGLVRARRRQERQAMLDAAQRRQMAAVAALAGGAAHVINTPLATIALAAKELELRLASGDSATPSSALALADDARLIRREVDRCRDALQRLRSAAHAEGPSRCDLTEALEELAGRLAQEPRVQVAAPLAPTVVAVEQGLLLEALEALVDNALDADEHSRVTVRVASPAAGMACVLVCDDGPGLTAEAWSRAGEPFFTTKQSQGGMGLGLFLARLQMERFGGGLKLSPRLPRGVQAALRLPTAEAAS